MLQHFNVYSPLTAHLMTCVLFDQICFLNFIYLHFYNNFISISQLFLKYHFFMSGSIYVADVHSIKQFGKLYIKTIVSQIESYFFFKRYWRCYHNLNHGLTLIYFLLGRIYMRYTGCLKICHYQQYIPRKCAAVHNGSEHRLRNAVIAYKIQPLIEHLNLFLIYNKDI